MPENQTRICVISCYIGKMPWYLNLYLKSCEFNKSITFFIITDDPFLKSKVGNIHFVFMTLEEINRKASQELGFETNIKYPYKLCDFKPAYGVIFSEMIKGFDFWGFSDIDVIFGDIRAFFTDTLLEQYDILSGRAFYLSGFFSLFRNLKFINETFSYSKDFKLVFTSEKHYCFDECNFQFGKLKQGKSILEISSEIESMTHVVMKMKEQNKIRAFFDHLVVEDIPGNLEWKSGSLFYKNKFEALLYHLILFKDQPYLEIPKWNEIPDVFYINESYFSLFPLNSSEGQRELVSFKKNKEAKVANAFQKANTQIASSLEPVDKFGGVYEPLCPDDEVTLIIEVKAQNNKLLFVFPDRSTVELKQCAGNIFFFIAPTFITEIVFDYDLSQQTYTLTFHQIGALKKVKLYKTA